MRIFVTGGSRGIGAAVVRQLCGEGHEVYFGYGASEGAAKVLAEQTGATALACDVTIEAQVQAALAAAGSIDGLVLCAGVAHYGLLQTMSDEQWSRVFDVNVTGMFRVLRAAIPTMVRQQRGSIVALSSMWGQVGASCEAAYSASKGAVIALSKALAQELAPSGIRVNCVAPGVIDTDMIANLSPSDRLELAVQTPLGRIGTPDEIAQAVSFLLGDQARFITGQVLGVNGGFVI